jgi:hypothetical protein
MSKESKRINTGITLEADVVSYLESLSKQEDRDRSWLINAIVRDYSQLSGKTKFKLNKNK